MLQLIYQSRKNLEIFCTILLQINFNTLFRISDISKSIQLSWNLLPAGNYKMKKIVNEQSQQFLTKQISCICCRWTCALESCREQLLIPIQCLQHCPIHTPSLHTLSPSPPGSHSSYPHPHSFFLHSHHTLK